MKPIPGLLAGLLFAMGIAHATSAATPDAAVGKKLDAAGLKYEIDSDGDYKMVFRVEDDRTQMVWVNSNVETLGGMRIREVMSTAGPLPRPEQPTDIARIAALVQMALVDADSKKLGGWVLKGGSDKLAFFYIAQIPADTNSGDLRTVIEAVANAADQFEAAAEAISGNDQKDVY